MLFGAEWLAMLLRKFGWMSILQSGNQLRRPWLPSKFEPDQQGESREANRRVLFVDPLMVTYRVLESENAVQILYVRSVKRRDKS